MEKPEISFDTLHRLVQDSIQIICISEITWNFLLLNFFKKWLIDTSATNDGGSGENAKRMF